MVQIVGFFVPGNRVEPQFGTIGEGEYSAHILVLGLNDVRGFVNIILAEKHLTALTDKFGLADAFGGSHP